MLACRSPGRGEELAASLRAEAAAAGAPPPSLEVASLDLSSLDSVRAFAAAWDKRTDGRPLGALVNNAGIFDMGSSAPGRDDRGHEAHWGTNYLVRRRCAAFAFLSVRVSVLFSPMLVRRRPRC